MDSPTGKALMSSLEASKLKWQVSDLDVQLRYEEDEEENIQVVDIGVKHFYIFELAGFGVFEVEGWEPVVTVITLD